MTESGRVSGSGVPGSVAGSVAGSVPASGPTGRGLARCGWCRRVLPERSGRGRPAKFCSQKCRQWNWVAQQRAAELQLSEHELVIARSELDALHDDLYVLACAVEDTERDLAAGEPSPGELREMLGWLLAASRPLRDRELSAPTATPPKTS